MKTLPKILLSVLAIAATAALAISVASHRVTADAQLTPDDVKKIVRETITNEPELIVQALNAMQAKQAAEAAEKAGKSLQENMAALTSNPDSPVIGNKDGDVTVVEFFDYHCGYCKHLYPDIAKLVKEDSKLRVIMKEFPILGPGSMIAAKAAMAMHALKPEKYFEFHGMLMEHTGEFTEESVADVAAKLGVDKAAFTAEMKKPETEKKIQDNMDLGMKIGAQGTPTLIVGEELIPGAVGYDALKQKVDALRNKAPAAPAE